MIHAGRGFIAGAVLVSLLLVPGPAGAQTAPAPPGSPPKGVAPREPEELEGVEVSASRYNVAAEATAMKTPMQVYEVPLSVDVVPHHLIEDKQAFTMSEVLSNVGVQATDTSGWGAKSFLIRGFQVDNYYVDGVKQGRYLQVDPSLIQQIEVLRGAAGSLYGRIEPGGVVNVVSTLPQPRLEASVEQTVGSYSLTRTVVDVTGPVPGYTPLQFRVTGAFQYDESFRDTVYGRHLTVAPSISWAPSTTDRVDVRFVYQNLLDTVDYGIPVVPETIDADGIITKQRLASVRDSVYFGPKSNQVYTSTYSTTASWTHSFGDDWKLKPFVNWTVIDQPGTEGGFTGWQDQPDVGWGSTNPTFANIYVGNPSNVNQHQFLAEIDLTGKFSLLGTKNELLVSAEYYQWKAQYQVWVYGGAGLNPIDVNNPVYQSANSFYTPPSSAPPSNSQNVSDTWFSFTIQDMIQIGERVRVLIGLRYDHATAGATGEFIDYPQPGSTSTYGREGVTGSQWSPRVGVSVDATSWLSAYGSFSTGYGAPDFFSVLYDGSIPKAENSRQWELGVKGHWLGDRLVGRLTYFNLVKNNMVVDVPAASLGGACISPDPFLPQDCLVQVGAQGSQGLELQLAGRITSWLSVNAYYQYVNASVLDGGDAGTPGTTSFPVGNRLPNVPRNFGSLWIQYTHPAGFGLGGGGTAQTNAPFDYAGTLMLPGFVTLDAAASYRFPVGPVEMRVQLNVKNLTNTHAAYEVGYGGSGVMPNAPMSGYFTFAATYR
jgi:iron complex outermembrane receptor protein